MTPTKTKAAGGRPAALEHPLQTPANRSTTRWAVIVDGSRGPRLWGRHREQAEAERVASALRGHGFAVRVETES